MPLRKAFQKGKEHQAPSGTLYMKNPLINRMPTPDAPEMGIRRRRENKTHFGKPAMTKVGSFPLRQNPTEKMPQTENTVMLSVHWMPQEPRKSDWYQIMAKMTTRRIPIPTADPPTLCIVEGSAWGRGREGGWGDDKNLTARSKTRGRSMRNRRRCWVISSIAGS